MADTSDLAKKADLANLKTALDELNKLYIKLETVPVVLRKLSDWCNWKRSC